MSSVDGLQDMMKHFRGTVHYDTDLFLSPFQEKVFEKLAASAQDNLVSTDTEVIIGQEDDILEAVTEQTVMRDLDNVLGEASKLEQMMVILTLLSACHPLQFK